MKKKLTILFSLLIIILIIAALIILIKLQSTHHDRKIVNENLSLEKLDDSIVYYVHNNDNVYSENSEMFSKYIMNESYQNDIDSLLYNKKNDKTYDASNPLLVLNPYGTNLTGLYIFFKTSKKYKVEYTISVNDETIPDFTNTLPNGLSKNHEGQIIGLIQGMENTITLKLINESNDIIKTYKYKINIPDYETNSIKMINSKILVDENQISDGLYMISSINNSAEREKIPLSFYDRYGILRAEFTKLSGKRTLRPIFIDGKFLIGIDHYNYVLINQLGKIESILPSKESNNHDYIYSSDRNSIIYITGHEKIRELSLDTLEDIEILNFNDIMPDYYEKAKNYYIEKYNNGEEIDDVDWAHVNSIELVGTNDAIFSLRENSSIIYISNFYTNPTIKYIIAPERIYENTEYEKYLLTKKGDFPTHAGQHTVILLDDDNLSDGKYYLYFYNNNYAKSETVFNDDWIKTIAGAGDKKNSADASMYYKYLINENEKTYEFVDSIDVTYSNAKGNVQLFDDNYIVVSAKKAVIDEFNQDKEILLELRMEVYDDIYRAYKVDMKNFWFDDVYHYTDIKSNYQNRDEPEEKNNSDFYYSNKTRSILGINPTSGNSSESNIIYYDNLYFTIYDYNSDTLVIPSTINGVPIKRLAGINYANVKKIIIEEGIEEIGDYVFLGCENLEEIILPSTLKKIGKFAFAKCNNIKELNIPKGVEYIDRGAFINWKENQIVNVFNTQGFNSNWKNDSKAIFNITYN